MNLQCACCGGNAPGKQWFNQDKGYGICARCFDWNIEHETKVLKIPNAIDEAIRSYGVPGTHHSPAPAGMKWVRTELLDGKPHHCYVEESDPKPKPAHTLEQIEEIERLDTL